MRHPIDTLPRQIDPWAYARSRRSCEGSLPLAATHTLKQWAKPEETLYGELAGKLDEHGQTHVYGRVNVLLNMQCQRCLQAMEMTVDRDFDYVIIRDQKLEDRVEGPVETLICAEDELDVAWFLEEEVLLAMPMIAKHDDCTPPLDDVVISREEEPEEDRQHPFAALKELMKSKEH